MHKRLYARCDLTFTITARSPLLVQGAQAAEGAATFYRARDPTDGREKYCIPATTLKGVWRSAAEAILRSFGEWLACDPLEEDKENTGKASKSCSARLQDSSVFNSPLAYAATCPACRLFGSLVHAGLLEVHDAWAVGKPQPLSQTGIAIDRFSGGVKQGEVKDGKARGGALYSYQALPEGTMFESRLALRNFELWQIGLLALVFREMGADRVRLGSGTRKGLGHVAIEVTGADFRYPATRYEQVAEGRPGQICSALALAMPEERIVGVPDDPWLMSGLSPVPAESWADIGWKRFRVVAPELHELLRGCVEKALAPRLRAGRRGFFPVAHDGGA